jgi:hypothetical protein
VLPYGADREKPSGANRCLATVRHQCAYMRQHRPWQLGCVVACVSFVLLLTLWIRIASGGLGFGWGSGSGGPSLVPSARVLASKAGYSCCTMLDILDKRHDTANTEAACCAVLDAVRCHTYVYDDFRRKVCYGSGAPFPTQPRQLREERGCGRLS